MRKRRIHARVLAISPFRRGFAFAVLESPGRLLDWGVVRLGSDDKEGVLRRLAAISQPFQPTLLALEDLTGTTHGRRVQAVVLYATAYARSLALKMVSISRNEVRQMLGLPEGASMRRIAESVTQAHAVLAAHLPAKPGAWQREPERTRSFVAVGLGLVAADSGDARHSE